MPPRKQRPREEPHEPVELVNYYEKLPRKYIPEKVKNTGLHKTHISLPASILVVGMTGAGKSNWLMNFLHLHNDSFEKIVLCCEDLSADPLYVHLRDSIKGESLEIHEGYAAIPPLATAGDKSNKLIIFDDMVCSGKNRELPVIQKYYKMGRKSNWTSVFLTQRYYATPIFFRANASVIILKKINSVRDLKKITGEYDVGTLDMNQLREMYQVATENMLGFIMIITRGQTNGFYINFDKIETDDC